MRAQWLTMVKEDRFELSLRALGWLTGLILVAAPLAIGGTRREAQIIFAAGTLITLVALAYTRLGRDGFRIPWPVWGPIALIALGLLQLMPLPPSLIETLSPRTHEILTYSLADLGLYGPDHWRPLSLDPAATWLSVFQQGAFVATLIVCLNLGHRNARTIEGALVWGSALVAAIGLAHWATGAEQIFGVYQALDRSEMTGYFSTFVNNNTLAGYLTLGTLVGLGRLAQTQQQRTRQAMVVCTALSTVGVVLAASRGGHIALAVGLVIFWAFAHAPGQSRQPDAKRKQARLFATSGLLIGAVGILVAFVVLPDWQVVLEDMPRTEDKLAIWQDTLPYVGDFWLTGSGRGSFHMVFPLYQDLKVSGSVSHPENILLQHAAEWGVLGLIFAVGFGLAAWAYIARGLTRRTDPVRWGLVAGLAAVGLQQLVDYGFESAGQALPVAAALGLAIGRVQLKARKPQPKRVPALALSTLVLGLGIAGLLAWKGPLAVAHSPAEATTALRQDGLDAKALVAAGTEAAALHPADYLIPLTVAARLANDPEASMAEMLRWVNRAIFLFPEGGRAHLLAARLFIRAGRPSQATVEYRMAIAAEPWRDNILTREVIAQFKDPLRMLQAVPDVPAQQHRLVDQLLQQGERTKARTVLDQVLLFHPDDLEALIRLGALCLRTRDIKCAERAATQLVKDGRPGDGYAFKALLAARAGETEAARLALKAAEQAGPLGVGQQRRVVQVYWTLKDIEGARKAIDGLWRRVALDDGSAASALMLQGRVEADIGDRRRAIKAFSEAVRRHPSPDLALKAASQILAQGQTDSARALLDEALAQFPEDDRLRRRRASLDAPLDSRQNTAPQGEIRP
ncbi:MAG: tetratricopeptide repeat protein [Bradymonadia bacterium]